MNERGKCTKCCSCITCGLGPKLTDWSFQKIGWTSWSLTQQMVAGVCCSMSFVLTAMGFLITVRSLNTLFFLILTRSANESILTSVFICS